MDLKLREVRARYQLQREGYSLEKSRARTGPSVGGYMIVDPDINCVVRGGSPVAYSLDIEDVEDFIAEKPVAHSCDF